MKKCLSLILLLVLVTTMRAQVVENKFNLYFSCGTGSFHGGEIVRNGSYSAPSLYSGFNSLKGIGVKGLNKVAPLLSIGAAFDFSLASDWHSDRYFDFEGSKASLYSFSPVIQFHNRFSEKGFFNLMSVRFEISPGIGVSSLSLSRPLFDIYYGGSIIAQPMKQNDLFYGLGVGLGIEYSATQSIGLFINYSGNINFTHSDFYSDTRFFSSHLRVGTIVKLNKRKRYYY